MIEPQSARPNEIRRSIVLSVDWQVNTASNFAIFKDILCPYIMQDK
jgi:hypothetical protein